MGTKNRDIIHRDQQLNLRKQIFGHSGPQLLSSISSKIQQNKAAYRAQFIISNASEVAKFSIMSKVNEKLLPLKLYTFLKKVRFCVYPCTDKPMRSIKLKLVDHNMISLRLFPYYGSISLISAFSCKNAEILSRRYPSRPSHCLATNQRAEESVTHPFKRQVQMRISHLC